jgi:hypothetical protein
LPLYIEAAVEDRDARIGRRRKFCGLMDEFDKRVLSVSLRMGHLLIRFRRVGREPLGNGSFLADRFEVSLSDYP